MHKLESNAKIAALTLVALSSCAPADGHEGLEIAVQHEPFRTAIAGENDHAGMTEQGLSFLFGSVADDLAAFNEDTDSGDTQHRSEYHVDNCRFEEAFATLNRLHGLAVDALDPDRPRLDEAKRHFGMLTHTAQDFYAHSNWVEIGVAHLVDKDHVAWPAVSRGSTLHGLAILEEGTPADWQIERDDESRVPTVFDGKTTREGLISGTYDNDDPSVCPTSVAIPHGPFILPRVFAPDDFLAKDAPLSPYHDEAVAAAIDQTREEFCRLVRRVTIRYGNPGRDFLLDAWVANREAYAAACPHDQSIVASVFMAAL